MEISLSLLATRRELYTTGLVFDLTFGGAIYMLRTASPPAVVAASYRTRVLHSEEVVLAVQLSCLVAGGNHSRRSKTLGHIRRMEQGHRYFEYAVNPLSLIHI